MPRQYMVQTQAGLLGPLSEAKILEYASNGVLQPSDQVQRVGREGTYAASTIRGYRAAPPPHEPRQVCSPPEPSRTSEQVNIQGTQDAAEGSSRLWIPVAIVATVGLLVAGGFVVSQRQPPITSVTRSESRFPPEASIASAAVLPPALLDVDENSATATDTDGVKPAADDADPATVAQSDPTDLEPGIEPEPSPKPVELTEADSSTTPAVTLEQPSEAEPPSLPVLAQGPYVVIPMHGTVGKELLAEGIETAVEAARVAGAKTVVFDIDSGGGKAIEAQPLADAVLKAGRFATTVARIHDAFSAAVFPAVACDVIVMLPGSAIGATVAYSGELGATEVNAKFNSALNAKLAELAKSRGHAPHLVEAMGVPVHEVWMWEDEATGSMRSGNVAPEDGKSTRIDDSAAVLTLSADRAVALGFAYADEERDRNWRFDDWNEIEKGMAARHMKYAVDQERVQNRQREREVEQQLRELDRLRRQQNTAYHQLVEWIGRLPSYVDDANSREPDQFDDYFYYVDTGSWTTQSQIRWRRRTDDAIRAWDTVRLGVDDIAEKMKDLDLVQQNPGTRAIMERHHQNALNRIRYLRENRDLMD